MKLHILIIALAIAGCAAAPDAIDKRWADYGIAKENVTAACATEPTRTRRAVCRHEKMKPFWQSAWGSDADIPELQSAGMILIYSDFEAGRITREEAAARIAALEARMKTILSQRTLSRERPLINCTTVGAHTSCY